ncbi:MAG: signal recognition particle receptor subunit alpha, partial [Chthoniobacterales bacterium]
MFSRLSDKLQDVFKDLRGHGRISEENVNEALREMRIALLEADVHFKVAKDFVARVKEKSLGQEVLRSVTPGQQFVKILHYEVTALICSAAAPVELGQLARMLVV